MNSTEQALTLLPINFLKLSCFLCNLRQPYEINISFIYLLNPQEGLAKFKRLINSQRSSSQLTGNWRLYLCLESFDLCHVRSTAFPEALK